MGRTRSRLNRGMTRKTLLRRLGIIGIATAAVGLIGYEAGTLTRPSGRAAKLAPPSKTTIPSTYTANPSDFTQKIGLPGAPSKIPGSVRVLQDDPRVRFRGGATRKAAEYPEYVQGTGITPESISPYFEIEFLYDGRKLEIVEYTQGEWFTPIFDGVIGPTYKNTPIDATLRYRLLDFGKENIGRIRLQLTYYKGLHIE